MKNKILTISMVFLIVVACVFGLVACGDEEVKVSCTLATTPEHITQVQIEEKNGNNIPLGKSYNIWSSAKQINSGEECVITVCLEDYYSLGSLKMTINGTEIALVVDSNAGNIYTCKYTPTSDFEIKFTGEAKRETVNFSFESVNWSIFFDENFAAGERDLLLNNLRVKVIVDSVVNPQYNGVSIRSIENINATAINKGAKVEVVIYSTNENVDFTLHNFVLSGGNDVNDILQNVYHETDYTNGNEKGKVFTVDFFLYAETITIFIC